MLSVQMGPVKTSDGRAGERDGAGSFAPRRRPNGQWRSVSGTCAFPWAISSLGAYPTHRSAHVHEGVGRYFSSAGGCKRLERNKERGYQGRLIREITAVVHLTSSFRKPIIARCSSIVNEFRCFLKSSCSICMAMG